MGNSNLTSLSRIPLGNGAAIPVLGLGTYKIPEGQAVEDSVTWALAAGYRHIDTAKIYGNETGVGRGIAKSRISREEIFVTTKLWNADQGYKKALAAIDASLSRLGLNYVDLYLIHWPFTSHHRILGKTLGNKRAETWGAMEEILKSGKAKAVGVSNYTIEHLEEMKTYMKIPPAVDQVEFHPFLYQKDLQEYCNEHQIVLEAYSPLMHGKRLEDERIGATASVYGKTNAQVLIRWSLQHGCVVLPKSMRKERIFENSQVFDFVLSPEEMAALDSLNEDYHACWDPTKT
ncbi:MAG: aldo/keto reductase [Patescibacteria group bacterium]|nr:aldo/keto reductase [Patescibacteria group bacterium]